MIVEEPYPWALRRENGFPYTADGCHEAERKAGVLGGVANAEPIGVGTRLRVSTPLRFVKVLAPASQAVSTEPRNTEAGWSCDERTGRRRGVFAGGGADREA